ncbi:MAG TPA: thioredoxin family protein [Thermoanaerobaculia bacterium]|nr:thioredoxin family protein [Thermoanaerobaculia bacterium]
MTRPPIHLRLSIILALAGACVFTSTIHAQPPRPEKADVHLTVDRTAYESSSTARVAALVSIEHGWHINSHTPTFDYLIPTVLDIKVPAGWPDETVQYPKAEMQTFAFADQPLAVYDGDVVILSEVKIPQGTPQGTFPLSASLRYQACNDSQCLPPVTTTAEVQLTVGPGGKPVENAAFAAGSGGAPGDVEKPGTAAPAAAGLPWMLALALLGGLILNAMPCVLPVLSLKVFGLVRSAGHGRMEVVRGALATSAGILVSFWALALAAVAARAAGAAVGWGVQFQRPGFVAFLAVVVVLFCLNLWGLFEISLPERMARVGAVSPREGAVGHFASGLFATLMATPCSAPFLGTAIGFALAQETPVILAIFTAVGIGMSLPYLLLAAAPGTARFLPRPGAWMETVRGVMGFLLAAAAVWLFYVLSSQMSPERVAAVQLGLLGLALFTWLRHRGFTGASLRNAAAFGMAAAVAVTLALAIWSGGEAQATETAEGLIRWEPFDRGKAEQLATGGQLVFVDVTADWCFTCKVNEQLVLNTPEVARVFGEHGVVPMKADWTNRDDEIGKFLAEHGRYGIPFYVLYRPGQEPRVFSELLTKEKVLAAVKEARAGSVAQN